MLSIAYCGDIGRQRWRSRMLSIAYCGDMGRRPTAVANSLWDSSHRWP